jgi:cyclopropane-fatty-acyl-phospholipid synthase
MDLAQVARELFESPSREFTVRLWDGTTLVPARGRVEGRVVLRTPHALYALLPPVSERRLADAVLDGEIDLEGDTIAVLLSAALWEGPRMRASLSRAIASAAIQRASARPRGGSFTRPLLARLHSIRRDREAVQHHYDLSDDFYRLFLDPAMVYSSGYFAEGGESIEQAQQAKLELVCRKLGLARGDRFLDVGCGWGALVAHAVGRDGVEATGITLSENQLAEARRRLTGNGSRGSILAADYRTLPAKEKFHKIASIGMMEHVGRERLREYFGALHRLLRPGGLLLNQAIADTSVGRTTLPWASRRGGGFIERHIFPDSDLVPLGEVVSAAERAGFEVRDVESLREHYDETLAAWLARLEAHIEQASELVGSRRARAYRLYLASSAAAFRLGRISVFQLLLAKPTHLGHAAGVQRCRAAWYRGGLSHPAAEPAGTAFAADVGSGPAPGGRLRRAGPLQDAPAPPDGDQ